MCDKRIRFSHMKRGAAQRDLTSAFVCAFRLVSGTKTWPAKTNAPCLHWDPSDNNNQINHAQAGVSALSWYRWAVGSVRGPGSTLVHWFKCLHRAVTQPGLCAVKLGWGVKVEKSNKHSISRSISLSFSGLSHSWASMLSDLIRKKNCPWSEVTWFFCCN